MLDQHNRITPLKLDNIQHCSFKHCACFCSRACGDGHPIAFDGCGAYNSMALGAKFLNHHSFSHRPRQPAFVGSKVCCQGFGLWRKCKAYIGCSCFFVRSCNRLPNQAIDFFVDLCRLTLFLFYLCCVFTLVRSKVLKHLLLFLSLLFKLFLHFAIV